MLEEVIRAKIWNVLGWCLLAVFHVGQVIPWLAHCAKENEKHVEEGKLLIQPVDLSPAKSSLDRLTAS